MKALHVVCWLAVCSITSTLGADPFLEGHVTDEHGRPIEGASVTIADCIGSFCSNTTVLTDADGHYIFESKPFEYIPVLSATLPGRYEVSRDEIGPELQDPDTETPRRVDFVLGTPAATHVYLPTGSPVGWSQSLMIRRGRMVDRRRYDYRSRNAFRDRSYFDMLPLNEDLHLVLVRERTVIETDDSEVAEEQRRENRRTKVEIVSPPFRLTDPQLYEIRARLEVDAGSDTTYIVIESVTDAIGNDRAAELVIPDPQFGPPVDADAQEEALALLERVAVAATPWNARPSAAIESYEYDVIDADEQATHVTITQDSPSGPAWSDISRQRGFAYMPPLRWLFSQPENIVFHGVDIGADRAVLHYRLKEGRGFGAGLGIGPGWNGFFTRGFSSGTLTIDPQTATVLEHRLYDSPLGDESVETFSDYVAVGEGYAPRSLTIQTDSMEFQLSFRIHEDRLWLLEAANNGDQPSYRIENVVVNVKE